MDKDNESFYGVRASDNIPREVKEMIGLKDIGMHKDALALAQTILSKRRLGELEFSESVSVILICGDSVEGSVNLIQAAFRHLSKHDRRQVRTIMLGYYHSINDMNKAKKFIARRSSDPIDLKLSMDVLLATNRLDAAKKIFACCRRTLPRTADGHGQSLLLAAMAGYCERIGMLGDAELCWSRAAELDEPLLRNALSGLVRVQAVRALELVRQGFKQIEKFSTNDDAATAIMLHGNHDQLLADAKKELETYREALEKIVPQKDLWRFGVNI